MTHPDLLTVSETAAALRVSRSTVRRLIKIGALDAIKVSPKVVRVKRASLEELLKSDKVEDSALNTRTPP
jgi:excisionase family DNA binding protein